MANAGKIILTLFVHAVMFLSFGSFVTVRKKDTEVSFTKTVVFGFFLYHVVFQIVAVPLMFACKPLSLLSAVWAVVMVIILFASAVLHGKIWMKTARERFWRLWGSDKEFWIPILIAGLNVILVSVLYVSFWDATYYVGQVSFSVYTDTINMIDPLSGEFLEVFDLKHCLATYHVNDAVICQLFGLPALVETKTIMVVVIAVLTNLLYYMTGSLLFQGKKEAVAVFMVLTLLVNICTYSAYTASGFLMYRTYEGKAVTANISILAVVYLLLRLYREEKREIWYLFVLASWGAVAVASSAMFLIPAALAAGLIPYAIWKRKPAVVGYMIVGMLPCLAVIACYLLGRMGMLEIAVMR